MLFRRLHHDRLAQYGYLIACQATKEAIVVDPLRDPAPYLDVARKEGVRITLVTETHVHADFVSGAAALAQAAGAELLLSGEGAGPAAYDKGSFPRARWLRDGDRITLGRVRLDVWHVPGHTPEHVAFVVTDTAVSDAPMGLLSGDFLFVGDVGRPDLLERAAGLRGTMETSARQLLASLQRLASLPDHLQIWPGHGAGSACGKSLGAVPQSTLGYERLTNWALQPDAARDFVSHVLEGQPDPPPYFARMKRLNARGAPPLPPLPPVTDGALREQGASGALVVDLRPAKEFAAGHLTGAINLPYGSSFLAWSGSVIPPDRDVVLSAPMAMRAAAEAAARELALIGIDRVRVVHLMAQGSYGEAGWSETLSSIPAAALATPTSGVTVVDVRNRNEWDEGHIPGARLIPLPELVARIDELRDAGPIAVHCQGGSRSAVAVSVLSAAGVRDVSNVEGGFSAWMRAGNTPVSGQ